MKNPFESIESRLNKIESLILELNQPANNVINQEKENDLLTIYEASKLLNLSKATLYSKHSKREIPDVYKQGGRLYFSRESLINWIKEGRTQTESELNEEIDSELFGNKKGLK